MIFLSRNFLFFVVCIFLSSALIGCGSLTGIPGHGGGKRFAIEQELVAACTRATIKQIDFSVIRGKKVNLFLNAIGDTGSGNLLGGRFSVVSQLRGNYIQSPPVVEEYVYPRYTSTTNTSSNTNSSTSTSSSGVTTGVSTTTGVNHNNTSSQTSGTSSTSTLLSSPSQKTVQQQGGGSDLQVGMDYKGLGSYTNSDEVTSDDLQYLSSLFQTYLFLQGVHVVPPSEAEIDIYVIVDIFGTVRTRVDWFIANNEILKARTALETLAIEHDTGRLVMEPQTASSEAEYNEQYILWAGPVMIKKYLRKSDPLLCDFTDVELYNANEEIIERNGQLTYPFRRQIENWMDTE